MMAPLQSKEMKFGANYMPAPMGLPPNRDHKPSAPPSTEVEMNVMAAQGSATDNRKASNQCQLNMTCIAFSLLFVIICCVITGLEIINCIELTKLKTETQQLKDKMVLFEKYYPVTPQHDSYNKIERLGQENYEREVIRALNARQSSETVDESVNKFLNTSSVAVDQVYDGADNADDYDDDDYYEDGLEGLDDGESDKLLSYDENSYGSTEKDKSRKVRSVSSGDNGIPIIEESYAIRRHPSKNKTVDEALTQMLKNRSKDEPRLNYDWSNKSDSNEYRGSTGSQHRTRQFPKKYRNDDNEMSTAQDHRHYYHLNHPDRAAVSVSQQRRLNQYANHQLSQKLEMRHRPLELQDISNSGQPKPRRRGMPKHPMLKSMDSSRIARSMGHAGRFRTIGIHFEGDTSRYEHGNHEHYDGNGRLRHPGGVFTDWKEANWGTDHGMDRMFRLQSGVVTIPENGLYYVYAQIFYHDDHDTNSFVVERNSRSLFQCTTATHTDHRQTKSNTCHTSGITYLTSGDTLFVRDLGSHRYTLFDSAKSFFGLIKLGDIRLGPENMAFNSS